MFRALQERQIVKLDYTLASRHKQVVIGEDLQTDFSLNQSLSLYLLDTLKLLDPNSLDFAVDSLTLVESIIENPDVILRRQLDKISTLKMAEMKAEGIEFDQRIEELQKLEYPKPNRDFIYDTFNQFAARHPWVGGENIRPKSIAREMYETFQSFDDYVKEYGLQRSEGILLRYLSDVYKVLFQTVPETSKTEDLNLIIDYIGSSIRGIDSSLVDEWEKIRHGSLHLKLMTETSTSNIEEAYDITRNQKEFTIKIRNEVFRLVKLFAAKNYEGAAAALYSWDKECSADSVKSLEKSLESDWQSYFEDHPDILTDRLARSPQYFQIAEVKDHSGWQITQTILDSDEGNDWEIVFFVDRQQSKEAESVALSLLRVGAIGSPS
jgi:hypothetical protein